MHNSPFGGSCISVVACCLRLMPLVRILFMSPPLRSSNLVRILFMSPPLISSVRLQISRRDSIPYAALYIAPILIDTRLHSTRGQFFIRLKCGACIRLRTNTLLLRMISRSAYGFSIFVITCLHTSDERVQTLHTSCIRIVSNTSSVLYTRLVLQTLNHASNNS